MSQSVDGTYIVQQPTPIEFQNSDNIDNQLQQIKTSSKVYSSSVENSVFQINVLRSQLVLHTRCESSSWNRAQGYI